MIRLQNISKLALVAFGALALVAVVAGAQEMSQEPTSGDPPGRANYLCTPAGVGVYAERVHVRCTVGAPVPPYTIYYFAVSTSDPANAARFLSVFETAKATARNLQIFYTPEDTSGTAIGCGVADCRLAWGAEIQQ